MSFEELVEWGSEVRQRAADQREERRELLIANRRVLAYCQRMFADLDQFLARSPNLRVFDSDAAVR